MFRARQICTPMRRMIKNRICTNITSPSSTATMLFIFYGNGLTIIWKNGGIDKIFNPVSHFDTSSFYLCIVNIKNTQRHGTYYKQRVSKLCPRNWGMEEDFWKWVSEYGHSRQVCRQTRLGRDKRKQYIPMAKLQDSRLWDSMVEARAKRIMQEAVGICWNLSNLS